MAAVIYKDNPNIEEYRKFLRDFERGVPTEKLNPVFAFRQFKDGSRVLYTRKDERGYRLNINHPEIRPWYKAAKAVARIRADCPSDDMLRDLFETRVLNGQHPMISLKNYGCTQQSTSELCIQESEMAEYKKDPMKAKYAYLRKSSEKVEYKRENGQIVKTSETVFYTRPFWTVIAAAEKNGIGFEEIMEAAGFSELPETLYYSIWKEYILNIQIKRLLELL